MYFIIPLINVSNVAVRVPALSATLYQTYEEAEQEAKHLAAKHKKTYHIVYVEGSVSNSSVISINNF